MKSESFKIGAGYALICLIWGSTWLAIKLGLESLTPFISAGVRFLLASLFVFSLMKIKKIDFQTDPLSIKLYLMLGFFSFAVPFFLVYWAQQFIPSGLASILFAFYPFSIIIFSRLLIPNEEIGPFKLIGVSLGFAGIVIIFSDSLSGNFDFNFWGIAAVVLSAAFQGLNAVIIKKHGKHLNPLGMNLFPLLIAGFFLTSLAFIMEEPSSWKWDEKAIFPILYLAFFGTVVTFTTYYWLLKRINVVLLSISAFITPIIAVLLGILFAGEVLSSNDLAGSSFVLAGILFANFRGLLKIIKSKEK